ncbi:MAG TPA: hypothetical protein VFV39_06540, partial [Limnobacter sp.]|nr:hypothetical protein [Limnobacter sp.]
MDSTNTSLHTARSFNGSTGTVSSSSEDLLLAAETLTPYWLQPTQLDAADPDQRRLIASSQGLQPPVSAEFGGTSALQDFLEKCVMLHDSRSDSQSIPVIAQFISPLAFSHPANSKDACLHRLLASAQAQAGLLSPDVCVQSITPKASSLPGTSQPGPPFRDFEVSLLIRGEQKIVTLRELAPDFRSGFMSAETILGMLPLLTPVSPSALVSRYGIGRTAIAHVILSVKAKLLANPSLPRTPGNLNCLMMEEIRCFELARGGEFLSQKPQQRDALWQAICSMSQQLPVLDVPAPSPPPGLSAPGDPPTPGFAAPPHALQSPIPETPKITQGLSNSGNACFINALISSAVGAQGAQSMLPKIAAQIDKVNSACTLLHTTAGCDHSALIARFPDGPNGWLNALEVSADHRASLADTFAIHDPEVQTELANKIGECCSQYAPVIEWLVHQLQTLQPALSSGEALSAQDLSALSSAVQTCFERADVQEYFRVNGLLPSNPPATIQDLDAQKELLNRVVARIINNLSPGGRFNYGLADVDLRAAIAMAFFAMPEVANTLQIGCHRDPWGAIKAPGIQRWRGLLEKNTWAEIEPPDCERLLALLKQAAGKRLENEQLVLGFLNEMRDLLHSPLAGAAEITRLHHLAQRLMQKDVNS